MYATIETIGSRFRKLNFFVKSTVSVYCLFFWNSRLIDLTKLVTVCYVIKNDCTKNDTIFFFSNFSFSIVEMKRIYRGFKTECPTGLITEEAFHGIYSRFFPQGGNPFFKLSWLLKRRALLKILIWKTSFTVG